MPAGAVHLILWKRYRWTSVACCVFVLAAQILLLHPFDPRWSFSALSIVAGYLLGFFIDPDLDQVGITSAEGRMLRHLKIFGTVLVAWFVPYGWLFTHRSFWSHFPVVGTTTRLVWLFAFASPLIYFTWPVFLDFWFVWFGLLLGMSLADTVHFFADEGMLRL